MIASSIRVPYVPATGVIPLLDGVAEVMGEGLFIVIQPDEFGVIQSVVLTPDDLRAMLAAAAD